MERVLFTGDAHSDILEAAIQPLAQADGGRLRVDVLKVGHLGSKANTSKLLLHLLDCTRFAFSTNGDRHDHPRHHDLRPHQRTEPRPPARTAHRLGRHQVTTAQGSPGLPGAAPPEQGGRNSVPLPEASQRTSPRDPTRPKGVRGISPLPSTLAVREFWEVHALSLCRSCVRARAAKAGSR